MSCQMAASKGWDFFHIDLKTAFLQGQSCEMNRDVVCQLPPKTGHPPHVAAQMKKHAYGMNDAPALVEHPWQGTAKFLFGFHTSRSTLHVLCSCRASELGNTGDKGPSHSSMAQKTHSLTHENNKKWKLHLEKTLDPLGRNQLL